jgi:hypothetical protein
VCIRMEPVDERASSEFHSINIEAAPPERSIPAGGANSVPQSGSQTEGESTLVSDSSASGQEEGARRSIPAEASGRQSAGAQEVGCFGRQRRHRSRLRGPTSQNEHGEEERKHRGLENGRGEVNPPVSLRPDAQNTLESFR